MGRGCRVSDDSGEPAAAPLQQLVERAKVGNLSTAEVDHVAQQLKVEAPGESTYDLLYVLSRTRATRYESTVASFSITQKIRWLLGSRCKHCVPSGGQTSRYLSEVRRFVVGVDWDDCGDVRQVALSAAGEFLRDNRDCGLLQAVYNACSEANVGGVDERTALEALARALGTPLSESLSAEYLEAQRPELLAQGASWLESQCGGG